MTVERLALILVYANALQLPCSMLEMRTRHIDLTRPSQFERDCLWAAEMSRPGKAILYVSDGFDPI